MRDTLKLLDIDFEFIPADKGLNYIICKEFKEVFLGVYELECGGKKVIAECIDTINGDPVVKLRTTLGDYDYNTCYVLQRGEDNVILNIKSLNEGYKKQYTPIDVLSEIAKEEDLPKFVEPTVDIAVVHESFAIDIDQYKADAIRVINENYNSKKQTIEQLQESLTNLIDGRLSELKKSTVVDLDKFKTDVSNLFESKVEDTKIDSDRVLAEINSIKNDVTTAAELWTNVLTSSVQEKVDDLETLKGSVIFDVSTKIAELETELVNHKRTVTEAYESIQSFIDKSKKEFVEENNTNKAAVSEIQENAKTTISENIKRAESLVGKKLIQLQSTADKKINDITALVENKLATFNESIVKIDEAVKNAELGLADTIKEGIISLQAEAKEQSVLFTDRKTELESLVDKTTKDLNSTIESLRESVETKIKDFNLVAITKKDLSQLKKQFETRLETEAANLKKYVAGYGGGGSVAQQFANGGTVNGSLNVNGQILSGGVDLASIFTGGGGSGYQTLTFVQSSALLTITPFGNTVSLSSLSGGSGPSGEPIFTSWAQTYSANYESTYTTVKSNSANWNYQGTDIKALTGNWQSTYTTVNTTSSSWSQTLSFDGSTSNLTITPNGNTVNIASVVVGKYLPLSGGTLTGAVSTNQDIEITDSTKGIILKSPSNFKYRVTVTDAGELVTTLV